MQQSLTIPEHLVTGLEPGDVLADRLHLSSHIQSQATVPRLAEPGAEAGEERLPVEVVEVGRVQGCRADAYQHAVIPDGRHVDVRELEHVGRAGVPGNVPLYERFGFPVTREADAPDGGPHIWFMPRDPG